MTSTPPVITQNMAQPAARAPQGPVRQGAAGGLVPIRSLNASHRDRVLAHLLALDEGDRYLRFGYAAGDAQLKRYVAGLDFERDDIFGIYNRRLTLIAVAHLAFAVEPHNNCAEFGVSVLKHARGRGYGARLFHRAALHARIKGVKMFFIHALSENTPMLKIARKAGARVQRDGGEAQAWLQLPPAGLDAHMTEMVTEQLGEIDYQFKKQARRFWGFLADVQEIRRQAQNSQWPWHPGQ